jgi:hypothetical protein
MSKSKDSSKNGSLAANANSPECTERGGPAWQPYKRGPGRPPKPRNPGGRPPKLINQIDRAMRALDANLPMLIDKLIELAYVKGDKDIIMYLIDRKLGRPRQEVSSTVRGAMIVVSPDEYATAIQAARAAEQALLAAPALQEES